jgi:hypothetical protein
MNVEFSKHEIDWIVRLSEEGADVKQTILAALNLLEITAMEVSASADVAQEPEAAAEAEPVARKPRGKKTKEPTPSA